MTYCFEHILPKNYYINMLPMLADIKLLKYILKEKLSHVYEVIDRIKIDLNFLLVSWFLLIFVEISNYEL